jgi:transcription antitermination factor NusG
MVQGSVREIGQVDNASALFGARQTLNAGTLVVTLDPWLVLRTKTKCEKYVRDKLQSLGMEAFVPLKKRTVRYNRKVKTYELPLITCYTFVRLDKEKRNQVLALPYVQGVLRMNGKDCLVSDREMQWLQKVSGTDLDIQTETLSMQKGDKVMLAHGHLAGMEGIIISQRSKHEVVIALESIGMQMVLQVDPAMLVRQ